MTTPDLPPELPPFPPPYKTIRKTETGAFAIETLADGSTRDLGEIAISDFNAEDASAPAAAARRARPEPGPVRTTTFGAAKGKSSAGAGGNSKAAMYLKVPFADKDQAKAKGARWDADQKKWYAPHGVDLNNFKPWWPETLD